MSFFFLGISFLFCDKCTPTVHLYLLYIYKSLITYALRISITNAKVLIFFDIRKKYAHFFFKNVPYGAIMCYMAYLYHFFRPIVSLLSSVYLPTIFRVWQVEMCYMTGMLQEPMFNRL